MSLAEGKFWRECDRYHDIAESFEKNIEIEHPGTVNSKRMCICLEFTKYCEWAATSVIYYKHKG